MYWFILAPYKSPPNLGVASHLLSLRCNSYFQMVPFQCHPYLSFCLPLWMAPTWTWLGSQKKDHRKIPEVAMYLCIWSPNFLKRNQEKKKGTKTQTKKSDWKETLPHTPLKLWFQNDLPNHVCLMNQNALFRSTTRGAKSPITHPKVLINKFLPQKTGNKLFKKKHGTRTSHCACSLREPELQLSSWVDSL